MSDDVDDRDNSTVTDFVPMTLQQQIEEISTELFNVNKMFGVRGRFDAGLVMEHYQCSYLVAICSIEICDIISLHANLRAVGFMDSWRWRLRKKYPREMLEEVKKLGNPAMER